MLTEMSTAAALVALATGAVATAAAAAADIECSPTLGGWHSLEIGS